MPTQILSQDINQNAVRFVTEEIASTGTTSRNFNITYNPIGFSSMLSHITITKDTAGMNPYRIMVDSSGNVFYGELTANVIRKITPTGSIGVFAGNGTGGFSGDGGPATSASVNGAYDMAFDTSGNFYFCDAGNYRIRKIDSNGIITTLIGDGTLGAPMSDGPLASGSTLGQSTYMHYDANTNNLYFSVMNFTQYGQGYTLRKLDLGSQIVSTVASNYSGNFANPVIPYPGDGTLATDWLFGPSSSTVDSQGNVYTIASSNWLVVKIDQSGLMTKVAGLDQNASYNGDNIPATGASLFYPSSLFLDSQENLYIVTDGDARIRKVDANTGIITTYAGNGSKGFSGDGGPAISGALFNNWGFPAIDSDDNIYLTTDHGNIRIITPDQMLNNYAGYGNTTYTNGTYLLNNLYVAPEYVDNTITNATGLVKYANLSGTYMYANLSSVLSAGFSAASVDKFIVCYTTTDPEV